MERKDNNNPSETDNIRDLIGHITGPLEFSPSHQSEISAPYDLKST